MAKKAARRVEYRYFPVSEALGLWGGICAPSQVEAEDWGYQGKGIKDVRLVRVRLEYTLPQGRKVIG